MIGRSRTKTEFRRNSERQGAQDIEGLLTPNSKQSPERQKSSSIKI